MIEHIYKWIRRGWEMGGSDPKHRWKASRFWKLAFWSVLNHSVFTSEKQDSNNNIFERLIPDHRHHTSCPKLV